MNLFNRILSILLAALIAAPAAFAHQDSQMAPANSYTARLSGYMPKKVQNFMDSWNKPDETKTETAWFYERIQLYMKSLVGYKLTATEYAQIRSRSSLDASVAIIFAYVAAIYGIPKYGKTIFKAVQPSASKGLGAVSARYKKLSKKAFETYQEFQTWKNKKPEDPDTLFLKKAEDNFGVKSILNEKYTSTEGMQYQVQGEVVKDKSGKTVFISFKSNKLNSQVNDQDPNNNASQVGSGNTAWVKELMDNNGLSNFKTQIDNQTLIVTAQQKSTVFSKYYNKNFYFNVAWSSSKETIKEKLKQDLPDVLRKNKINKFELRGAGEAVLFELNVS